MSENLKFWKKTIFWTSVMETLMVLSGLTTASLHELNAQDVIVWSAGFCGLLGMMVKSWIKDHNNNGVLDFFE